MKPPFFDRRIALELWRLAWPVIGLNLLNVLALAIDTAMCGRLPEHEAALMGLGFATQIIFLLMVGMLGLVVGTVALVSRAHGSKDNQRVAHIVQQSTQLTLVLSAAVGLVGVFGAEPMLALSGAEGEALRQGVLYLQPLLGMVVFNYLTILYAAILRGVGETRMPLMVGLLTNGLNYVFNYGLILGNYGLPSLGVRGAALGTVMAQAIGVVVLVVLLRRGFVRGIRLRLRPCALDRELVTTMVRVGVPAAADLVLLNAGLFALIRMLAEVDPLAVAAHGVGLRVQSLAFVPGLSVSQATGAMVGQALGKSDRERARAITRASVVLCTLIMSGLAIMIVAGAEPIVTLFDVPSGSVLSRYSVEWIEILGFGMPIVGAHIAFTGTLRGSGASMTALRINLVTTAIQIPLSAWLGFGLGLGTLGIWAGFPLSFVLKTMLDGWAYRRDRWSVSGASPLQR